MESYDLHGHVWMIHFPLALDHRVPTFGAETAEKTALLPDRARSMADVDVEPTPYEVVYRENKLEVRHYEPRGDRRYREPVVFAYAFVNTPAILDLEPGHSVVGQFLDRGFDVFLIDWRFPSRLDAHLSLYDYVVRYLDNCVATVRERSDADEVHLVGTSTGATLAATYAALFPETVAALGLQGPPLDFDADGGMFDFREMTESADPQLVIDVFGNVPAEWLDLAFSMRKPVEYTVGAPLQLWDHLDDEAYVERAARVARWAFDGPDLAGETYRQFVERLLSGNELVENRLTLGGTPVDLENVAMPVALVVGEHDEFVPETASRPFLDAVPSDDTEVFEFPTGHVGTFVDPAAHDEWWPRVCDWFERRSRER